MSKILTALPAAKPKKLKLFRCLQKETHFYEKQLTYYLSVLAPDSHHNQIHTERRNQNLLAVRQHC